MSTKPLFLDLHETVQAVEEDSGVRQSAGFRERVPAHREALVDGGHHVQGVALALPRATDSVDFDAYPLEFPGDGIEAVERDVPDATLRQFCFSVMDS